MWQIYLQGHLVNVPALIAFFTYKINSAKILQQLKGERRQGAPEKCLPHCTAGRTWNGRGSKPAWLPQRCCHSSTVLPLRRTFTPACCLFSILEGRTLPFITSFSLSCYCRLRQKSVTSIKYKMLYFGL